MLKKCSRLSWQQSHKLPIAFRQLPLKPFSSPIPETPKKTEEVRIGPVPNSFAAYMELGRFHKPVGAELLAWPFCWSVGMGTAVGSFPDPTLCAAFFAASFLMRSGGCVVNDLWDRDLDRMVERTKVRPLASGALNTTQAMAFLGANIVVGVGCLSFIHTSCFWMTFASLPLVVAYPLAKRYTNYPQAVLGSVFGWGSLVGYLAATSGVYNWPVMLPLYLGCWNWIIFYDTIYGHQDKVFDKQIGVKSTALTWGDDTKKILNHFANATSVLWALSGYYCGLNWIYYAGVMAARGHMEWQRTTVDLDNPDDCFSKFRSNSYLAGMLFLAIILGKMDSLDWENLNSKKEGKGQAKSFTWERLN